MSECFSVLLFLLCFFFLFSILKLTHPLNVFKNLLVWNSISGSHSVNIYKYMTWTRCRFSHKIGGRLMHSHLILLIKLNFCLLLLFSAVDGSRMWFSSIFRMYFVVVVVVFFSLLFLDVYIWECVYYSLTASGPFALKLKRISVFNSHKCMSMCVYTYVLHIECSLVGSDEWECVSACLIVSNIKLISIFCCMNAYKRRRAHCEWKMVCVCMSVTCHLSASLRVRRSQSTICFFFFFCWMFVYCIYSNNSIVDQSRLNVVAFRNL